jgi:phosphatidylglycerol:prolipoprotein diacylglycerol transferase
MIPFPNIDPVIVKIGPLSLRWYGMMYLGGFAASYLLVGYQLKRKKLVFAAKEIDSLYTYLVLGLILGARLGYILFYDLGAYLRNPIEIFAVWHGGMSFHGGLIGSVFAGVLFSRIYRMGFWELADIVIVTAPIGLGLGRIGNFINGELYGRVTDVPWAMVFPAGGPLPRHPSQLYECLLEGPLLFVILWLLKDRDLKPGVLLSVFLILYGIFRFFVEFFREPDPQLGLVLGPFSMGQVLSAAVILAGAGLLVYRQNKAV